MLLFLIDPVLIMRQTCDIDSEHHRWLIYDLNTKEQLGFDCSSWCYTVAVYTKRGINGIVSITCTGIVVTCWERIDI